MNLFGIGPAELLIILFIIVVMFGGPVLIFVLGYALGKKSSEKPVPPLTGSADPASDADAQAVEPPKESLTND